jgi:hypothetical protein
VLSSHGLKACFQPIDARKLASPYALSCAAPSTDFQKSLPRDSASGASERVLSSPRARMASISLSECFTIVDFKFLLAGVLSAAMSNDSSPCRYRTTPCTNTFPIGGHGQLDKKVLETFPTNDSLRPTRERHLDRRRDRRLCRLRREIPIPPTRRASVLQDAVREAQGLGLYSLSLPETIGPWCSYR